MRFLRINDSQQRARIIEYGSGIKNQVLPISPTYEAIRVLESKGAELQAERDRRNIGRIEIARHVCSYWGLKLDFARDNIIQRMESSDYFTHFLVPKNGSGRGRVLNGIPTVYLHTALRTADYLALLGYDDTQQKAFFDELKKGIPNLLFAPSPLRSYRRGDSPLEHVPFEEQLKERGLI